MDPLAAASAALPIPPPRFVSRRRNRIGPVRKVDFSAVSSGYIYRIMGSAAGTGIGEGQLIPRYRVPKRLDCPGAAFFANNDMHQNIAPGIAGSRRLKQIGTAA
jgi:hypothetical protein